jgi:broad specificity phosphatase PhoE
MAMIYMVRHGQASFGQENYDRLSEKGILQMRALGEYWAGIHLGIDAIYSGPLERQKSSAQEVIRHSGCPGSKMPESVVIQDLREYDYRAVLDSQMPDMLAKDRSLHRDVAKIFTDSASFKKVFGGAVSRWASGRFDKPGVETWDDFSSRVCKAVAHIASLHESGGNIMVFASGGNIAAVLQRALFLSNEHAVGLNWQIINASVSRFKYGRQQIVLAGFNAISHLELKKNKTFITYR